MKYIRTCVFAVFLVVVVIAVKLFWEYIYSVIPSIFVAGLIIPLLAFFSGYLYKKSGYVMFSYLGVILIYLGLFGILLVFLVKL